MSWNPFSGSINLLDKDSTSHSVCQITVHEDFDSELMVNDIAIVRLQKSISLNETVWPACIPSYEGLRQKPGKFAYMLGKESLDLLILIIQ